MTPTFSWNSCWRALSFSLIMLMLTLRFSQPCHAALLQEGTYAGDPTIANDSKPVNVLVTNLPAMDSRRAPDRNGFHVQEPTPTRSMVLVREAHSPRINWKEILGQSGSFLGIQQGWRVAFQPTTREALKGKFFDDWFEAVKSTRGWGDGDDFLTNYVGHPMAGGVVGNIFVQNDPRGRATTFGRDPAYWTSRLKGMLYTAAYSAQFELGPISEASIGNVGHMGNSQSGAVDLVVTPLAGFGWQVGEDILDKYLIIKIESWTTNPVALMFARSVLNPTRAFANLMRLRVPWSRETRPGIFGRDRGYYDPQPNNGAKDAPSTQVK